MNWPWKGVWNADTLYALNNIVHYAGSVYISLGNSQGSQPDISPSQWAIFASQGNTGEPGGPGAGGADGQGLVWRGDWEETTEYEAYDLVHHGGAAWIALTANDNIEPGLTGHWGLAAGRGNRGLRGVFGGAIAIEYTYSMLTADEDPGDGFLRLGSVTPQSSATTIRASIEDTFGTDWGSVLDHLADGDNTVKGHIRLTHREDLSKYIRFEVYAVSTASGYRNITVGMGSGNTPTPFDDNDPIVLTFSRTGDKGDDGEDGANSPQIDIYTANGTWNKPAGATLIEVVVIGAGGGGGSGALGIASVVRQGGQGGGGGGYSSIVMDADDAADPTTITVGTGGAGGTLVRTSETHGNPGSAGTVTSFGNRLRVAGGHGGTGGATSPTANTNATTQAMEIGGQGHNANATQLQNSPYRGAGGGGRGAGADASNVLIAGTNGGDSGVALMTTPYAGGTGRGNGNNVAGGDGISPDRFTWMGGTGGGGGSRGVGAGAPSGPGGNGGYPGGGGGGGGSRSNGENSGAGGNGANGMVIVVTYF